MSGQSPDTPESSALETKDWLDSLDEVLERGGPERVRQLLHELSLHAYARDVRQPFSARTPYINTIPFMTASHRLDNQSTNRSAMAETRPASPPRS